MPKYITVIISNNCNHFYNFKHSHCDRNGKHSCRFICNRLWEKNVWNSSKTDFLFPYAMELLIFSTRSGLLPSISICRNYLFIPLQIVCVYIHCTFTLKSHISFIVWSLDIWLEVLQEFIIRQCWFSTILNQSVNKFPSVMAVTPAKHTIKPQFLKINLI
jgi:hypothetical protein